MRCWTFLSSLASAIRPAESGVRKGVRLRDWEGCAFSADDRVHPGCFFSLAIQDAGTLPIPWHMPQAAEGAHRLGTLGLAGHSKNPRPPHPGQGTMACWDAVFLMIGISVDDSCV